MSDIDYGLLLGSTNDEIWDEEIAKTAGGRAMRKAMIPCRTKGCVKTPRRHFQDSFDDSALAAEACEVLAPHEGDTDEALIERLTAWGAANISRRRPKQLDDIFERLMSAPGGFGGGQVVHGGVVHVGPDGTIEGGGNLPPGLKSLIESIFSDDDPTAPPKGSSKH